MKTPWYCLPVLLVLASCVSIESYPQHWANLDEGSVIGECPDISGLYQQNGESLRGYQQSRGGYNLSDAFLSSVAHGTFIDGRKNWAYPPQVEVRLNQQNGQLLEVITLYLEGEVVHQDTLSMDKGDYSCDGKSLIVKHSSAATVGITTIFATENRNFGRGEDGSLVMKSWFTGFGYAGLLVPFLISETTWVRWLPIESESPAALSKEAGEQREPKEQSLNSMTDPSWQGEWAGSAVQSDGSTWPIRITLGERTGNVHYPSRRCGGKLAALVIRNGKTSVQFTETIIVGDDTCVSGGNIVLERTGSHSANFYWYYPNGEAGAHGKLTQVER